MCGLPTGRRGVVGMLLENQTVVVAVGGTTTDEEKGEV